MKRSVAQLPLHGGKAPPWLFSRMTKLAGAITMAIVDQWGPAEMLRRLADPWWFQAFGCVLGFDWHSSGLTTVTCGALKEAAKRHGDDLGVLVAGGKGGVMRKTPGEIEAAADRLAISEGDRLVHASRLSAKVDTAALQDGFSVYHHSFFFLPTGAWCVVQQGMSARSASARRYHWLGEHVRDFVCEPHEGIRDLAPAPAAADMPLLNMVAREAEANREGCASLVRQDPDALLQKVQDLTRGPTLFAPAHHDIRADDVNTDRLKKILRTAHERNPGDFQTLLGTPQVGPATVRSLSLLAELIYEAPASHRDPALRAPPGEGALPGPDPREERRWADYAYAHGGKDGVPFPVDRDTYDRNIAILTDAVRKARMGETEKSEALKRLGVGRGGAKAEGRGPGGRWPVGRGARAGLTVGSAGRAGRAGPGAPVRPVPARGPGRCRRSRRRASRSHH